MTATQLLDQLADNPDDSAVRERAARALEAAGEHQRAAELLSERFIHFNAHDPGELPCLCRACIGQAGDTAEAGGIAFHRAFVTATGVQRAGGERDYVLFFWMPDALLPQRGRVLRSVAAGLRGRLS